MTNTITLRSKLMIAAAVMMIAAVMTVTTLGVFGFSPAQAATDVQPTKRTINVSGQGTIDISPDIAYVTLGVVTEDSDAKLAQQNNAKSMDKVISQVKSSGVKSEDIKTISYSIYPKYDYNKDTGASKITGYTVNNTVQVTVRDIAKTGTLIDLAAESGVNMSNSISFGLGDYEKYYNDALKKAVDVAKKRAETMAGTLGITLKTPVTVTENGGYAPSPVYGYGMKADAAGAPATPVEAGTIEVKANVSMVYEY